MQGRNDRRAWYFVSLLTALYVFSFVDRHILAILAQPISRSLALSDTRLALVIGAGFSVVYALVALPLSQVVDQSNRKWVVVGGAIIWSLATIGSGFANSFAGLATCRLGVAFGEAALVPAAVSIIADLFTSDRRTLPTSVFGATAGIMGKGAFVVGAGVLAIAGAISHSVALEPWRIALILVGLPGLVLGLVIVFTQDEPSRYDDAAISASAKVSEFLAYLRQNWAFYACLYCGTAAAATFTLGMIAWTATLMVRAYNLDVSAAALMFGVVGGLSGLVGTIFWPWLTTHLARRGNRAAVLVSLAIASFGLIPFGVVGPASGHLTLLLIGVGGAQFCLAAVGVLVPLAAQTYGPARMRGRLMALQLIALQLIGSTLGPLAVALFAKHWAGNPAALGYGIASLAIVAGPISGFALLGAVRLFSAGKLIEARESR